MCQGAEGEVEASYTVRGECNDPCRHDIGSHGSNICVAFCLAIERSRAGFTRDTSGCARERKENSDPVCFARRRDDRLDEKREQDNRNDDGQKTFPRRIVLQVDT